MLAETTVLLSLVTTFVGIGTPLLVKEIKEIHKTINKHENDQTRVETKLDIFLEHSGFDMPKVNKAIKEHMAELAEDGKPSVGGCINIKELYKEGEHGQK
jgi:hypothetical protein